MKSRTVNGVSGRRKVAHLTSVHDPNDTRILHKECAALAKNGYDVVLIAPGVRDGVIAGIPHLAVPMPRNRFQRVTKTMWSVYRRAVSENAHVYHFHDPELMVVGLLLTLRGARVIFDVHEDIPKDIGTKRWIPRRLRRIVAAITAGALRASQHGFAAIVPATPGIAQSFSNRRTVIVHNYPILQELQTGEAPGFADRSRSVAYLGSISRVRGITEMIDAVQSLHGSVRLRLIGGFETPALESNARGMAGWDYVDYEGRRRRHELGALLAQCRAGLLILHPVDSFMESLPTKLFEYMAAGLPVIASDFPLWRRIVEEAQCGLLVNPLDPQAVTDAIQRLVDSPDEAEAMGKRGRQAVLERFQWEHEAEKLCKLYATL